MTYQHFTAIDYGHVIASRRMVTQIDSQIAALTEYYEGNCQLHMDTAAIQLELATFAEERD